MKIRSVVVISLFLILSFSLYLLISVKNENKMLRKNYNNIEEQVRQNEIDRDTYYSKVDELEKLKSEKSSQILKYEEVEEWNKGVKQYLD